MGATVLGYGRSETKRVTQEGQNVTNRAWLGIGLATIGMAAAAASALPTILDQAQDWTGPVGGAGFFVTFVGLFIGASSK